MEELLKFLKAWTVAVAAVHIERELENYVFHLFCKFSKEV